MTAEFRRESEDLLLPFAEDRIAVAVSGGGDSLALLHLLADLAREHGFTIFAVTVDHGLRKDAASEAKAVEEICGQLGVSHTTLKWQGWDGSGNVQNEARKARYELIANWARSNAIKTITLGHTKDDQAETFLMRLARGSGVDGLSAMAQVRSFQAVKWVRPLLSIGRKDLRRYLTDIDQTWIEDPSNEDFRFERIKTREALKALADLGIGANVLSQVASNMRLAKDALARQTLHYARQTVSLHAGACCMKWEQLHLMPEETRRRLLKAAFGWLSGSVYAPRRRAMQDVWAAVSASGSATLDGCRLLRKKDNLWICRELNAIRNQSARPGDLWDGRWRVTGDADTTDGLSVRSLGVEGLAHCPNWRELGIPREVLLTTPGLWNGEDLVACPLVIPDPTWHAVLERGEAEFFDAIFSH